MHKMRWRPGLRPDPTGVAFSALPDLLAGFLGRGREVTGKRRKGKERGGQKEVKGRDGEARERRGGRGEDGRGREGNQSHAFCFPNLGAMSSTTTPRT